MPVAAAGIHLNFSMKKLLLALLIGAMAASGLHAQNNAKGDDDTTELGKSMDDLSAAFKKLRRQVKVPAQNASSLALLKDMRAAAEKSIKLTPAMAADQPADKRDAFVAAYQKKMREFIATLEPLQAALESNKNEEAAELITKLGGLQKQGHKQFKKPD